MSAEFVKTVFYLDPPTRTALERFADERKIPVSQAIREMVSNQLSDRVVVDSASWVLLALSALLRYHPNGDLEKVVRESMELSRTRQHG